METTRQTKTTAQQIGQIMKGRTLASFTYGEWDHILSLVDKHIAECERRAEQPGETLRYAYGPNSRAKFQKYRDAAKRRAAQQ